MTPPNQPTRRTVLRKSAVAGSIGVIGIGATTGSAAAKEFQGGSGFLDLDTKDSVSSGEEFTVFGVDSSQDLSPSCNAQGNEKEFACYSVSFCGSDCEAVLCINPNRRFEVADDSDEPPTHRITQAKKCPEQDGQYGPVYHVSFQPIR